MVDDGPLITIVLRRNASAWDKFPIVIVERFKALASIRYSILWVDLELHVETHFEAQGSLVKSWNESPPFATRFAEINLISLEASATFVVFSMRYRHDPTCWASEFFLNPLYRSSSVGVATNMRHPSRNRPHARRITVERVCARILQQSRIVIPIWCLDDVPVVAIIE